MEKKNDRENTDLIIGRNAVAEALKSERAIDTLLVVRGEKPSIVSEVKCSQVLYDTIDEWGGISVMCKTGHGYIKSKMKETGALLAGEVSGHTFFKDRYFGYDDAVYAGCRLIEIIAKNKNLC